MNRTSSSKNLNHYPVMLNQVLQVCEPEKGGLFVDCTFGAGGYSNAILSYPKTKVIAIDRDLAVAKYVEITKKKYKNRFSFHNSKFSELNKVINKNKKVDSIIFDLGLSSLQVRNLDRGFSFNSNAKADMRMGLNSISAIDVINNYDFQTLKDIFNLLGEEQEGFHIASNIVKARKQKPIVNIPELVNIIKKSKKKNFKKKINISTKTFQAIRIFVNKEISELIEGLIEATKVLKKNGKIIVVSFHSIEDKIVKYFFTNFSTNKSRGSRYYPDSNDRKTLFRNYKNKIIRPTDSEIKINNPSRSAKLRFASRSDQEFFYPKDLKNKFFKYLELESRGV